MTSLVYSTAVGNYVEVARAAGVDPFEQLRAAKINPFDLNNPDVRLPAESVAVLLENSAARAGCEDFGLQMATGFRISHFGPFALIAYLGPTPRDVLTALAQYGAMQNEAAKWHIEDAGDVVIVHLTFSLGGKRPTRQFIQMTNSRLYECFRNQYGKRCMPIQMCFQSAAPRDMANHRRMFDSSVSFDCEFDGAVFRSTDLDQAIASYDPMVDKHVRRYLDTMVCQRAKRTLAQEVKEIIYSLLPTGRCNTDEVAQRLGLPPRTFFLHMKSEGESYAGLLDAVREEWVLQQLGNSSRALTEIAELLGFSSHSAFSRWFSVRFGCSPRDWRAGKRDTGLSTTSSQAR